MVPADDVWPERVRAVKFWLGTHMPNWLPETDTPLFVSAIRLRQRPPKRKAAGEWALDSGGFTELNKHGRWSVTAQQYADEVRRWRDQFGGLKWAAIQDWMCEPFVLEKTRLTVGMHQMPTVNNWIILRNLAPEIPWVPVLQGWTFEDYLRHADLYLSFACTRLEQLPLVGLGSVCRRQDTAMVAELVRELHARSIKVHGFGFKLEGVRRCARWLASADSLAWSFQARKVWNHEKRRMCDTVHTGGCANCRPWAEKWRGKVLEAVTVGRRISVQRGLFDDPATAEPVASA